MAMRMATGTMRVKTNKFIDLHCHILPAIDDGTPDVAASIALARATVADGIGTILATPHHMDRHYVNHAAAVQQATREFQEVLKREKIPLQLFSGQEIHLNAHLLDNWNDLLGIDDRRHYILLEFPHEMVPAYTEELLFELSCRGVTSVIAHPERNTELISNPVKLFDLIERGCLAQVTATSLVGTFGKQVQRTAVEFVKCGLVQVVASDAHMLKYRNLAMTAAYEVLTALGTEYSDQFQQNARDLINGETIAVPELSLPRKQRKYWLF